MPNAECQMRSAQCRASRGWRRTGRPAWRGAAGGWLLCEHGWDQAGACRDLLTARGFTEVKSAVDLAGIERIAIGRWLG